MAVPKMVQRFIVFSVLLVAYFGYTFYDEMKQIEREHASVVEGFFA
jgi:hypothetical protein